MPHPPLLHMADLAKAYPGVQALRGVSLDLHAGEVLALLGENGAGKSTLIKILAGAVAPDHGTIAIAGQTLPIRNPHDARRAGVAVIHQELNLVPGLTAAENIFLGQERATWIPRGEERRRAAELFRRIGVAVDPGARCRDLSVGQQQAVEIAKALATAARILVMDEPTAALTPQEAERLFTIVRELKSQGLGIIYVSHRLDEVYALADRVQVLRDGQAVGTFPIRDLPRDRLIELMVGRKLEQEYPRRAVPIGRPRLVARNLRRGTAVQDVSLTLRAGEVVGLAGLVGAGRTETARLLFGADPPDGGTVEVDGQPVQLRSPRDAIRHGIGLLTEDRKGQGLVLGHGVRDNFVLPNLPQLAPFGVRRGAREQAAYARWAQALGIKAPSPLTPARNLSGGNQQKVVLAKWLQTDARVLLFDEPTRGIDVGARYEIYQLINDLAAQGKAILLISSELPEVLGMADRILVMRAGRVAGEAAAGATQEQILKLAVGA